MKMMDRILVFVNLSLCFMLPGAICPTSSPTVLEFWPEANTTFTCLSREGDKESGLTFAVDNSVYVGLDQLGPDVKFVYQSRRSQDDRFSVTTTLIFHDGASGSTLSCCYVDGTNISWRESFLLLCICPSQVETTTMPADTTTEDEKSPIIAANNMQNSTENSFPVIAGDVNNKLMIGIVVAALLLVLLTACCWYFIPSVIVAPYCGVVALVVHCIQRLMERKAECPPHKEVVQETNKALISPSGTPVSKDRAMRPTKPPGNAVTRAEATLSPVLNDGMPPMTTPMIAGLGESVVDKKRHTTPTKCTSDSGDMAVEMSSCRLFFNPRSLDYYYPRESVEVHSAALPQTRAPAVLANEDNNIIIDML